MEKIVLTFLICYAQQAADRTTQYWEDLQSAYQTRLPNKISLASESIGRCQKSHASWQVLVAELEAEIYGDVAVC